MSLERVGSWIERLRAVDAAALGTGLSAEGAREAWAVALDAISPEALASALARRGEPYGSACFVMARTVFTAPIEWCAVLLSRGTQVALKVPSGGAPVAETLVAAAEHVGLPLRMRRDRAAVQDAELVVAMGSDQSMSAIAERLRAGQSFDPHGHRFSVAWVTGASSVDPRVPAEFRDPWGAVAADLALHDGRGCLSPVAVFTSIPLTEAGPALAQAMIRAERRWPLGDVGAGEWALARSRGALAHVTGECLRAGRGAVHVLPSRFFEPAVLPGHVALFHAPNAAAVVDILRPWAPWLSTVGTESAADVSQLAALGAVRICGLGRMQRPDLVRLHDGRDWVGDTVRSS